MARPREFFYPEISTVGREIRCQDGPWEVQYDRILPQRTLHGKQAKASPSPKSPGREGQVQPRAVIPEAKQIKDLDSYAPFFALTPERQAEVDRRMSEDVERIAAKQAEVEAK